MLITYGQFILLLCFAVGLSAERISEKELNKNALKHFLGAFRGPNAINITHFLTTFRLPTCMERCLSELEGLMTALSKSNETQDMARICSEMQSSTNCASSVGCPQIFTEATTRAYQFVCLDNYQSMFDSMECMKRVAGDIQPECEARCEVQGQILDDASKNKVHAIFNATRACNSTRCLLTCFKEKVDKKCKVAKLNFFDTLLNTITRDDGKGKGFEEALSWILPDYCQRKNFTKFESLKKLSTKPLSVGQISKNAAKRKALRKMKERMRSMNSADDLNSVDSNITETALIVDGEIRTLRYELLDGQGESVQSPDFETLTKMMAQQFAPDLIKSDHRLETALLSQPRSVNNTDNFLLNSTNSSEQNFLLLDEQVANFRSEERPEILSEEVLREGVHEHVAIGLVVFVTTVIYWLWEAAREI